MTQALAAGKVSRNHNSGRKFAYSQNSCVGASTGGGEGFQKSQQCPEIRLQSKLFCCVCRQDICCVCSQDICCVCSQDICCVSRQDICSLPRDLTKLRSNLATIQNKSGVNMDPRCQEAKQCGSNLEAIWRRGAQEGPRSNLNQKARFRIIIYGTFETRDNFAAG